MSTARGCGIPRRRRFPSSVCLCSHDLEALTNAIGNRALLDGLDVLPGGQPFASDVAQGA